MRYKYLIFLLSVLLIMGCAKSLQASEIPTEKPDPSLRKHWFDMTSNCQHEKYDETPREVMERMAKVIARGDHLWIRKELANAYDPEQPEQFEEQRRELLTQPADDPLVVYQSINNLTLPYLMEKHRDVEHDRKLLVRSVKMSIVIEYSIQPDCSKIKPLEKALDRYIKAPASEITS